MAAGQTVSQITNQLAIKKNVGGNFSSALSICSRAVLDKFNNVFVEPDFNVAGIAGATLTTAPALIFIDIATGTPYALVVKNGALDLIQR